MIDGVFYQVDCGSIYVPKMVEIELAISFTSE